MKRPTEGQGFGASAIVMAAAIASYFEGYVPYTYADPVGIATICYGHTGPDVTPGRVATKEECDKLLQGDLAIAYAHVRRCITVPLQPHQAAALTSATYNVGPKIVCGSTLGAMANKGIGADVWCRELPRWIYARGMKLRGLERRREKEMQVCLGQSPGL